MEHVDLGGTRIAWRIMGKGPAIVWTPGAWAPGEADPAILHLLAERFTVLVYDRPNSGQSDLVFDDSASEWEMAADLLHRLVEHLGLKPLHVAGASGGALVSLLLAYKYPGDVKSLFLGWLPLRIWEFWSLGAEFRYLKPARAVEESGAMATLLDQKVEHWVQNDWAGLAASHPDNRARLLSLDPAGFARTMRKWGAWFAAGAWVAGLSDLQLESIVVPTVVMPGSPGDDYHPESAARILARLMPSSDYLSNAGQLTTAEAAALSVDHRDIATCVVRFCLRVEQGSR